MRLFEEAVTPPAHRPKAGESSDNVTTSTRGNTKAYTLRRLAKDRPDLLAKVEGGEMSANQAAIGNAKPNCRRFAPATPAAQTGKSAAKPPKRL